jgi:hypothetical protein
VWDGANGPPSLVASLSTTAELLEGRVDDVATNGVHWGTRSALVAALSHFPVLEGKLEMLGSKCNADLREDQMGAHWIQVRPASDSLALLVLPSFACGPFDGMGCSSGGSLHPYSFALM